MLRLQFDQHIPDELATQLRRRKVDVLTTAEAGLQDAQDDRHLRTAIEAGRVFVTRDSDFIQLGHDPSNQPHPGILYWSQQERIRLGDLVIGLSILVRIRSDEEMKNRVIYLTSAEIALLRSAAGE